MELLTTLVNDGFTPTYNVPQKSNSYSLFRFNTLAPEDSFDFFKYLVITKFENCISFKTNTCLSILILKQKTSILLQFIIGTGFKLRILK